ncbi:MAG TPA: ribonuclease M5 [Bacillales bacterium]|nr:ribonuclease M5 [Bacillales bacterium]
MKIKEVIVVEGKSDTQAVQNAVCADTLETNGSAINADTLERIRLAQEKRGVIILTDPDYPGKRIRNIINEHVPGCKHAFIPRSEARSNRSESLGVEHASSEMIRKALENVREDMPAESEVISRSDLMDAGLIGGPMARERREKLGTLLHIGYTNGKQLHKRLQMFQITREEFLEAYRRIEQEESKAASGAGSDEEKLGTSSTK